MNADEAAPLEEEYTARLVACDEALAQGTLLPDPGGHETSPEVRVRLERDLACLHLLHLLRPGHGSAADAPPQPSPRKGEGERQTPARIGRFHIHEELGRGAFGLVFRAFDPRLDREVALKVPRSETLVTPELRERFLREAKAAAALEHPHVVPVYDADAVGPLCYIASAYCPGLTLAKWLEQQNEPVPERAAAQLLVLLAEALQHAHNRNIIHRDLKPSNIMLSPVARSESNGQTPPDQAPTVDLSLGSSDEGLKYLPRVMDFGLAKFLTDGEIGPTKSVAILGTPHYMAPEQAWGQSRDVGPAADIYALGVILYELLTGRTPFDAETDLETLRQVREQEPSPPRTLRPNLDRGLQAICLKCLEKEPRHRYASAQELANDLKRWLLGDVPVSNRWTEWTRRLMRRRGFPLATAAVLLISLTAIGVPAIRYVRHPDRWLEYYESQLDSKNEVTLIGETGKPRWFRVCTTQTPVEVFQAQDGVFSIKSTEFGLVELLPDPRLERYRFRIEVRHDSATGLNSRVGVYFLRSTHAILPDKTGHYGCTVEFDDLHDMRFEGPDKNARGNVVELLFRRLVEPAPADKQPGSRDPCGQKIFKPAAPRLGAGPWRQLVMEVDREQMQAFFPDTFNPGQQLLLGPVSRNKLKEKAEFLAANPFEGQIRIHPEFQPRSGLGLYVYRGVASFRLAFVQPLEENN